MSTLLLFLRGVGKDYEGRTLEDILAFTNRELEAHPECIRWLFPLPSASKAAPDTPIITKAEIREVHCNPNLQNNIRRSIRRMEAYFAQSIHWIRMYKLSCSNVKRIIRSTRLLLSAEDAKAFHEFILQCIKDAHGWVPKKSLTAWEQALK